ncbi:hypothetical protein OESDEN_10053 [Oesophagostomum dentatum]|uniref:Uncharacterized protein n=1 Tax=Oesophagostomum dentatum TaxID=61180 RepID=A0A0B1RR27_OESDE|nr:hypothetical protein OESDEN_24856 [Oesophagostomum dentatum]KHJ90111.1 hypothetical protein OESDEN_10053 [Oesophagostomum dentatum]
MSAEKKKGGLSVPNAPQHKNHVKFGEDVNTGPKPIRALSPAPKPDEVTAPPPTDPTVHKDEVELLRAGNLNKHGDRVKSMSAEKT